MHKMQDALGEGEGPDQVVREAMRGLDVTLACWPGIKFNEKGQNVSSEHPVVQVQNQEYAVVWPPLDDLMYPVPPWNER